ncbi:hypothetical protein DSUL_60259 [Desulfovibrionales bacterium]
MDLIKLIDLLIHAVAESGQHNIIAFNSCSSMYKLQSRLAGVKLWQASLRLNFSFSWASLFTLTVKHACLAFVTSPDNPSDFADLIKEFITLSQATAKLPTSGRRGLYRFHRPP